MALFFEGLAFVLTFWMVAWSASSIRTGSPDSGWWGSTEALALRQAARAPILTGDLQYRTCDVAHAHLACPAGAPAGALGRRWCRESLETARVGACATSSSGIQVVQYRIWQVEDLPHYANFSTVVLRIPRIHINTETLLSDSSLIHFPHRLRKSEILLNLGLGNREFFIRAITGTEVEDMGRRLNTMLFRGSLPGSATR
jgi:hypothetical protein